MDMGIVNAGQLAVYDSIDPELREACEDVVLNRRADGNRAAARARRALQGRRGARKAKEHDLTWREQAGRASAFRMRWSTASPSSSTPTPRRRGCGRAAAACHRRPADGRHERRRRPVRLGQDVPAAGGEIGPRDEAGRGRISSPTWRRRSGCANGERRRAPNGRQDPDGDGQGRCPRHRQEHRRRRAGLQQLRDHRPRRHGADDEDPRDGAREEGRHHRPVRPDHARRSTRWCMSPPRWSARASTFRC